MARSWLDAAGSNFKSGAEALHRKFLGILADSTCTNCQSAGFGEAILAAWLQTAWGDFTKNLIVASAIGTRRTRGTPVKGVAGVKSRSQAEQMVRAAAAYAAKKHGTNRPFWHYPAFAIEVGDCLELKNLWRLELALGSTVVPGQITSFRNYLIHPDENTRHKYEKLQATLGMHSIGPEHLLHQFLQPGLIVFTSWVRELQRIADDSTG